MSDQVFTISQLNHFIKDVLNSGFPTGVWVSGEIQNYERNKNRKHVFFDLVEKNKNTDDIDAKMGLVVFERTKIMIQSKLERSENAFQLKDDLEVKFLCKVDFYPPHGVVRLVVEDVDPTFTLGKLAQQKQELIADLRDKGLLELNKKHDMPEVPLRLGLITANESAAYNDFIDELRASGLGFQIYLADALMQGKSSEASICQAMTKLAKIKSLDAIVITRGGGSLADLAAFDTRGIAEAIANYHVPVITGIGHEINTSVADLTAHTFAKTPTAVAQFLVLRVQRFMDRLTDLGHDIIDCAQTKIADDKHQIREMAMSVQRTTKDFFQGQERYLIESTGRLKHRPSEILRQKAQICDGIKERMDQSIHLCFKQAASKIDHYLRMVTLMDPKQMLKKGFTITRDHKGKIIRHKKQVTPKTKLVTQLAEGEIVSFVQEVQEDYYAG